jgi:hypothetical protein
MTFDELFAAWPWKPIPNCPGRFVLPPSSLTPQQLLQDDAPLPRRRAAAARDPVITAAIDNGGLITYCKPDGRYVHTLNTPEGFERKLAELAV